MRLLLGLSPDGEYSFWSVFDLNVILKRPYQLIILTELLENSGRISQARDISKELLTHLTPQQLVLVAYIDRHMIQQVVTTDEMLDQLKQDAENDQELIGYMSKLVNRIKQENEESGVMIDQLTRFATKKKTIRGSIEPH